MNRKEVEDVIAWTLKERKKRVLNRNALDALFNAICNPIGSLGKIFLGREDALEAEKLRIKQDILLDILCELDDKISDASGDVIEQKDIKKIISGEIEARGYNVNEVIGVLITSDAGITELKPGTHIKVSGKGTGRVIGLQIGDGLENKGG